MALIAMTTADTIDYVSDLDPSKRKTKTARDPQDPSKGFIESWEITTARRPSSCARSTSS